MEAILKHPFVLLIFGAILNGLIIPLITRNWQRRQKVLEIKTIPIFPLIVYFGYLFWYPNSYREGTDRGIRI